MRYFISIKVSEDLVPLWEAYPPSRLTEIERLSHDYALNRDYHCPQCGSIWAMWRKEILDDSNLVEFGRGDFYPFRRSCPNHQLGAWTGDFPGSILLNPQDILVIPRALMVRELLLRTGGIPSQPQGDTNEQRA